MKYFYYGDDGFAIDAAVRRIINDFSSNNPGLKPMRLDASDGVTNDIIAQMIAVSLFEPSRLVIVRGVLAATATWQAICENINQVPDTTTLVLLDLPTDPKNVKAVERTKLFKELSKVVTAQKLTKPKYQKGSEAIDELAKTHAVQLDRAARVELLNRVKGEEDERAALNEALTKLAYLNRPITVEDIKLYIEPSLDVNAFGIFDCAIRGERARLHQEVENLVASGEEPQRFFGLIVSQINALVVAVLGGAEATKTVSPYQLNSVRRLVGNLGKTKVEQAAKVRQIVAKLATLDEQLKTSPNEEAWHRIEGYLGAIC